MQPTSVHAQHVTFNLKEMQWNFTSVTYGGIFVQRTLNIQLTYQQTCFFADSAPAFQPGKRTGAPGDLGASP